MRGASHSALPNEHQRGPWLQRICTIMHLLGAQDSSPRIPLVPPEPLQCRRLLAPILEEDTGARGLASHEAHGARAARGRFHTQGCLFSHSSRRSLDLVLCALSTPARTHRGNAPDGCSCVCGPCALYVCARVRACVSSMWVPLGMLSLGSSPSRVARFMEGEQCPLIFELEFQILSIEY